MLKAMHDFSVLDYIVGGAALALVIVVLGAITNAVLREAGFGTVLNGLLVSMGFAAGAMLRAVTLGFQ